MGGRALLGEVRDDADDVGNALEARVGGGRTALSALLGRRLRLRHVAAALAAFFTILFTILDDFLGPAFYGYELFSESWAVYFYGSFLALAPQTVCAIVTVSLLFIPLTRIYKLAVKRI